MSYDCYFTPQQIGITGHMEYSWSNDVREKIFQFQYQLIRTENTEKVLKLETIAREILITLSVYFLYDPNITLYYLTLFYKIIGQTRDIIDGKGEYLLTYMLICVWYDFYPELSIFALNCLIDINGDHPYGSWKDMKYFCNYCVFIKQYPVNHPLIEHCIRLVNDQLKKDYNTINKEKDDSVSVSFSLVAKWIPREKSKKFGWLFDHLACNFFMYTKTCSPTNMHKAILKSKTEYRKMISFLNTKLETLEIKQCNNGWDKINFTQIPSIALTKQANSFLNIKTNGETKYEESEERKTCTTHFKNYIQQGQLGEIEIKSKRVGIIELVKQAIHLIKMPINESTQVKIDMLNTQWKQESELLNPFCKMLPLLDVSNYMENLDSYYAGLGIALKIAEVSSIGKKILIFGGFHQLIHLDDCHTFVDMMKKVLIEMEKKGLNADLYSLLDVMIDGITESNMSKEDIRGMTIVILSKMEIDLLNNDNKQSMYTNIQQKFELMGCGGIPRILLWNLKSTEGFSSLSVFSNVSMTSGYNPLFINLFCHEELKSLKTYIPWNFFVKSLENKRYDILERKVRSLFLNI